MTSTTEKIDTIGATGFAVLLGLAALSYGAWQMGFGGVESFGRDKVPGFSYIGSEAVNNNADLDLPVGHGQTTAYASVLEGDTIALGEAERIAARSEAENKRLNARLRAMAEAKPIRVEHEAAQSLTDISKQTPASEKIDDSDQLENRHVEILNRLGSEHAHEMANLEAQLATSKEQAEIGSVALSKAEAEIAELRRQMEAVTASKAVVIETKIPVVDPVEKTGVDAARGALTSSSRELLARLDGIGDDPAKLRDLYDGDPEQGGKTPATSVQFGVGSHSVSAAKREELEAIAKGVDDSTRFLVVGYASTDGSAASNASLSNRRADAVAKEISAVISPSDRIEVIYFGQTKRFDNKRLSPNRIVEVWPIR